MNIIAHSYLSGDSDDLKLGNFIGDYVKGRDYDQYPPEVRKGILLHRSIDYFTDHNAIVNKSKTHLYETFHHYSGILVDIFYDHFLVIRWDELCTVPLDVYIQRLYKLILDHYDMLPVALQRFIHRFVEHDWLSCYDTPEGIGLVLERFAKRTSFPDYKDTAVKLLKEHYESFRVEFNMYFPQLTTHVWKEFGVSAGE